MKIQFKSVLKNADLLEKFVKKLKVLRQIKSLKSLYDA